LKALTAAGFRLPKRYEFAEERKMNERIGKLLESGQSIWLDNLSRKMMDSGELQRMIEQDGVRGITSNPTIFQKAIAGSRDYDAGLRSLLQKGIREEKKLFLQLAMEDVSRAADMLTPVYEKSGGQDGFVSIEVSPDLAYDTEKTIAEAKLLFATIGKKNILVKVPATLPGLPAIERLTAEGVNVNVTLLFSVQRYEKVAEAYLRGLETRAGRGQAIEGLSSVASFFVSRVDTMVDKLLTARLASASSESGKKRIQSLLGKAAVANARLAYRRFRELFSASRFCGLKGARIQRILWGSTGTKNPQYSDVKYVEELIGPDSINTIPETTLKAFLDHGRVRVSIGENLAEAESLFAELKTAGIDMDAVTAALEKEGVQLFADSYFSLLQEIAAKRDAL
jgi:transaldolase